MSISDPEILNPNKFFLVFVECYEILEKSPGLNKWMICQQFLQSLLGIAQFCGAVLTQTI